MSKREHKRSERVVTASVVALVVAALTFGISNFVTTRHAPSFALTSSPSSFDITSTIYASPACSGSQMTLLPGVKRCAVFSVKNDLNVPIAVSGITTSFDTNYAAPPAACSGANLTLPTFSGSLAVPAGQSVNSPGVTIELNDSASSDQDACQGLKWHFVYTGTATFTDSTTTALASSPNPSAFGSPVTFTATVTPGNPSLDGNPPSGEPSSGKTVTFYSCPTAACSTTTSLGTGTLGATDQATFTTSSLPAGVDYVEAVYGGSGTNFSASTSNVVTQQVVGVTLTSSPNPSNFGQSVTLRATVVPTSGPTGTVAFYLGTPSGSHATLKSGVALGAGNVATYSTAGLPPGSDSLYAVYSGDGTYPGATSAVITQQVNTAACISAKLNGGYVVKAGTAICITGRVDGGLTVQAGGALELLGGTVNGGLSVSGASAVRVCGSTVNGGITVSGSAGPVVIGDANDDGPPGCAGNTVNGNVTLSNNLGGVEFAKNVVIGTVTLTNNSGSGFVTEDAAPEVEGNTITGLLACTGNTPAPTAGGQLNTVTAGTKTGQCAGAGF